MLIVIVEAVTYFISLYHCLYITCQYHISHVFFNFCITSSCLVECIDLEQSMCIFHQCLSGGGCCARQMEGPVLVRWRVLCSGASQMEGFVLVRWRVLCSSDGGFCAHQMEGTVLVRWRDLAKETLFFSS